MTGYGRGDAAFGRKRVAVQMKSVNHRFVDIKLRGAPLDPALEEKVTSSIRAQVQRGSIAATIRVEGAGPSSGVRPDVTAAQQAYRELCELAEQLGIEANVTLELVCSIPGVMVPREADEGESEAMGAAVQEALMQALDSLVEMRAAEGKALAKDLGARVTRIETLAGEVRDLAAAAPDEASERLRERLGRLLKDGNVTVDETRLAQEVAVIADRQDVTEEVVRISSHIEQFRKLMKSAKPMGRRLDFLVQELGREINTVGSKSQSANLAALVVEAKAELEKIREQVQNVE